MVQNIRLEGKIDCANCNRRVPREQAGKSEEQDKYFCSPVCLYDYALMHDDSPCDVVFGKVTSD